MNLSRPQPRTDRWYLLALAGLSVAVLAWNGYRACTLSITHDEAFTYLWYVAKGPRAIFSKTGYIANNHILYSLLAWCSVQIFGLAEWPLRLPSVVAGALLVPLAARLFRLLTGSMWLSLLGVVVLVLNPLVMDFSTAARGYSLALAFSLWAWWQMGRLLDDSLEPRNEAWRLIGAGAGIGLAVAANLAFLLPHAVLAGIFLVTKATHERATLRATLTRLWRFFVTPAGLVSFGFCYPAICHLGGDRFYFGSDSLSELVRSLVEPTLLAAPERVPAFLTTPIGLDCLVTGVMVGTLLILVPLPFALMREVKNGRSPWTTHFVLIGGGLAGVIGLHIACHHCAGSPYPQNRTALYFLPLAIACSLLVVAKAQAMGNWTARLAWSIPVLLLLVSGYFVTQLQADFLYPWRYDAGSHRLYQQLCADAAIREQPLRVGHTTLYAPAMDFYRAMEGDSVWTSHLLARGQNEVDCYLFNAEPARAHVARGEIRVLHEDPISHAVIGIPTSRALRYEPK